MDHAGPICKRRRRFGRAWQGCSGPPAACRPSGGQVLKGKNRGPSGESEPPPFGREAAVMRKPGSRFGWPDRPPQAPLAPEGRGCRQAGEGFSHAANSAYATGASPLIRSFGSPSPLRGEGRRRGSAKHLPDRRATACLGAIRGQAVPHAPLPLEGRVAAAGWGLSPSARVGFAARNPHPRSLPSRGREAMGHGRATHSPSPFLRGKKRSCP